jgi:enolase
MSRIAATHARQILDSRGYPTIEVEVHLVSGRGRSGGRPRRVLDREGEAAEADMPLWRYLAGDRTVRLPVPLLDVLNGGVHAANRLDFEEFMIIPAGADGFSESLRVGVEVYHELRYTLMARGRGALIGAGGGFAPDLESNEGALETLVAAITAAGYEPGWDVWIGVDVAASQLRQDGGYALAHEGRVLSSRELANYYDELTDRYLVLLLEDGWPKTTGRAGAT